MDPDMIARQHGFVRLTDASSSAATSVIYVNLGAARVIRGVSNTNPPHTEIYFEMPALLNRNPGAEDVLSVKETPEEIFGRWGHVVS